VRLDLLHDLLQALLEIAAVARAGEKGTHVQGEHRGVLQDLRHLVPDDLPREPFGDGGLADARIADEERVVLLAPAEDLDRALDLRLAPDQGVDLAVLRLLVEVDAVGVQGVTLLLLPRVVVAPATPAAGRSLVGGFLLRPARRAVVRQPRALGDAVADVVDRVVAGHVLLLQEVGGVAFALGEDGDEHVRARDLLPPRGLDVDHRALDHPLEAGSRLRVLPPVRDQVRELVVDVLDEVAAKRVKVDVAGPHDGGGILVVDEREEEMLEGGVFVPALAGERQGAVEGLFKAS
jgi:hypothetical protein